MQNSISWEARQRRPFPLLMLTCCSALLACNGTLLDGRTAAADVSASAGGSGATDGAAGGASSTGTAAMVGGVGAASGAGGSRDPVGAGGEGLFSRRAQTQLTSWTYSADGNGLANISQPAFDDSMWAKVDVPHTWDSAQETKMVKRPNAWYRTHFSLVGPDDANQRIYLHFEGVFQVADVYLNGSHLGQHRGGYTAFTMDGTAAALMGDNVVSVQVSSADCSDCLPVGVPNLYKGYGGMYRKAWLIKTGQIHVATTDYASSGVYITPSAITEESAAVAIRTVVANDQAKSAQVSVANTILDGNQVPVLILETTLVLPRGVGSVSQTGTLKNPHLWNGLADPYLYSVVTTVSVDGRVADTVYERFGLRSYLLSAHDFQLNGRSTPLRGVAKHQETEYAASAVADGDLQTDWLNLQDLGVNFARLVHYPHAKLEYDLADQLGIMVWAENGHNDGAGSTANGEYITREMIYQNWNHPSIVFWSAGNEAAGVTATADYADVINKTDPSRVSTYASDGQKPAKVDYIFHNTYDGWYGNSMYDWLKSSNSWISETGAGMVISTQNANCFSGQHTVNSFEPENYGSLVDEVRFDDLFTNPAHVPAFSLWLFRDINDSKYKGHLNTKGLLTYSNYKKDAFYHYQSFLKSTPVIHVVGPHHFLRAANEAGHGDVKVYSNAASLRLSVNGVDQGSRADGAAVRANGYAIHHLFYWSNVLAPGRNSITASDGRGNSETVDIYFRGAQGVVPSEGKAPVASLESSVGAAYFINLPAQAQHPFYYEFDGTADNTFDVLPAEVAGAGWIATQRQSDPAKLTALRFTVQQEATVYIMANSTAATPAWIAAAGFNRAEVAGLWRNNDEVLVPYALYRQAVAAGARISLTPTAMDYVVLVKPNAPAP